MKESAPINVTGFITQEKYILGCTLSEIERILGFHPGRLKAGVSIYALLRLPEENEYQLAGYSQVAGHHTEEQYGKDLQTRHDMKQLTKRLRQDVWTTTGTDRLIKVRPVTMNNSNMKDDDQYPPGKGVPQWKLTSPVSAIFITSIMGYPSARYTRFKI